MRRFPSPTPSLLIAFLISHRWSHNPLSFALNITWLKPVAGDVYGSGAYLNGQWQSDGAATAFSFQLCNDGSSNESNGPGQGGAAQCGTSVQPSVVQNYDGSFQVTLATPEVLQEGTYVLQMSSDAAFVSTSPSFSLAPASDNSTVTPSPSIREQDPGNTDTDTDTGIAPSVSPRTMPNLAQSYSPASTAAYAVPLSLAGTVVLVASVVCAVQRKKLLHERAVSHEESKIFQNLFNGGRSQNVHHISSSGLTPAEPHREEVDEDEKVPETRGSDIYTRPYVPHLAKERRPRAVTKDPYPVATTGRTTVPASYFKASLSPRISYQAARSPSAERIDPFRLRRPEAAGEFNAAVNEDVIANYLQPSPIPPSLTPAPMQRVHVRQQASQGINMHAGDTAGLYEEVARRLA